MRGIGSVKIKRIPRKVVMYMVVLAICIVHLGMDYSSKKARAVTSQNGEWDYIENDDSTITISGYNGTVSHLTMPTLVDDKKIARIGEGAFEKNSYLHSILISNVVTEIGNAAFWGCSNLLASGKFSQVLHPK